ncbi:MoaD/ThiS family protein [Sungkyunkwania multivorans]|uniref:MoaD/ThiS family protein n=1 Tax=Sungkyunkwania multivorans TaxID=1173618 RepID=A0ABW3D3P6_9FLAO
MQLTIKYFGMVAEATNTDEDIIEVAPCQVSQLIDDLKKRYVALENIEFKVAVAQELVGDTFSVEEPTEIALLPPFAGG